MALPPAGRGFQRGAERTRGSTSSSVPAEEAEAPTVCQKVRPALRQGRRPRPGSGGAQGLPGRLRWVSAGPACGHVYLELHFISSGPPLRIKSLFKDNLSKVGYK